MYHFTKIFSVSVLGLAVLVGCSKPADTKANTEAKQAGDDAAAQLNITFATEGAYKPFNYVDKDGKLAGFDVEVANALCTQMKAKCDIVAQDWDGIIPGLMANKYDAIIAGMSITEERQKVVDFTEPYFLNSLVYIGKKGEQVDVTALSKQSIGAQRSTIASQYLEDNLASANDIKQYDSQDNAYLDLTAGRINLMLSDKVPALDWLKTEAGTNFELKGDEIAIDDRLAVAVRKNDPLKAQISAALADIKASGQYQAIYDKHFK